MQSSTSFQTSSDLHFKEGKRTGRRRFGGFTFVEVMMAATIMTMGLCGCLLTLMRGLHAIDTARSSSLAAQIMQSEVERLRLLSWNDVSSLPRAENVDLATIFIGNPQLASRFQAERLITPVTGRETSMVDVTMRITWRNVNGKTHTRSFSTRYSKNGLYDFYYTVARS